jgi:hypothetical protein
LHALKTTGVPGRSAPPTRCARDTWLSSATRLYSRLASYRVAGDKIVAEYGKAAEVNGIVEGSRQVSKRLSQPAVTIKNRLKAAWHGLPEIERDAVVADAMV